MSKPVQLVGTRLGRYQIEALLAQGQGAHVYRAIDAVFERVVVIKLLDPAAALDPGAVAAFIRDAEALMRLSHPHILPIYEATRRDDVAYIVRQHTDGGTLRGLLQRHRALPIPQAIGLLRPIATALDYAHRQGFLHGNLKPSNILLTTEGHVFVTDFIVPGRDGHGPSAATTVVGILDAPEYVSPEQARGVPIERCSDLYVLGVVLYEAILGRPPFQSEGPNDSPRAVLARHLNAAPPPPRALMPTLSPAIEEVLLRGLAKVPESRYPTGAALFYALGEAMEQDRGRPLPAVERRGESVRPVRPIAPQTLPEPTTPALIADDIADVQASPRPAMGAAPAPQATLAEPMPAPLAFATSPATTGTVERLTPVAESEAPTLAMIEALDWELPAVEATESVAPEARSAPPDLPAPLDPPAAMVLPAPAAPVLDAPAPAVTVAEPVADEPMSTTRRQRKAKQARGKKPDEGAPTPTVEAATTIVPVAPASPDTAQDTLPDLPDWPAATPSTQPESSAEPAPWRALPEAAPATPATAAPRVAARPASAQRPQPVAWRYAVAVIGVALLGIGLLSMVMLRRGAEEAGARTPDNPAAAIDPTVPAASDSPLPSVASVAAPTAQASTAPTTAPATAAPTAVAAATSAPQASAAPSAPALARQEVILYSAQRKGERDAFLYAASPDGQNARQIAQLPAQAWGAQIAADKRSVAYSVATGDRTDHPAIDGLAGKGTHDLYLANTDGSAPVRLTTTTAWNAAGSWSPDGTTLAFTSNRDGNWEIYTLTFPSGKLARLTNHPAQDGWPAWLPDGKHIAFMSTRDGLAQLYTMNADGSGVARLFLSESDDSYPVVSPDGTKIAFVVGTPGGQDADIYVMGIDGSNATRLTTTGNNSQPTWSPDSARLAFASTRDGEYAIYTMRADGSAQTRVTKTPGATMTPTWGFLVLPMAAPAPGGTAGYPLTGDATGALLAAQVVVGLLRRRRA